MQSTSENNSMSSSTPAQTGVNCTYSGGGLTVQRGTTAPVMLPVTFRGITETEVEPGKTTRSLNRFLSVMIDKRAPGLWAGVIGGPKSKVEHLAELAVTAGVVNEIAVALADVNLMRSINDKLIRSNQRFKAGVFTIDYPMLQRAVAGAIGASSSQKDAKWIVSRIITELLSRAYAKLNVMVPFVGAAELSEHLRPIARLDDLIRAADVASVNEVFEAIELSGGFDASKEFNPAVAEAMIGPLLTSAANRLMNCLRYSKYMRDTAVLVGRSIAYPSLLPVHLQDSADLAYLATNASFAVDAINRAGQSFSTPDFDLRDAIQYTVMRLREMKRFETWSLEKLASHYAIDRVLTRSGYVAGVIVARHNPMNLSAQVTRFVDRTDVVVQLQSTIGEAYLSPLVDAVNRAYEGNILDRAVMYSAAQMMTLECESNGTDIGGYVYYHGMTADESLMLGLAHAEYLTLGNISPAGTDPLDVSLDQPQIYFEIPDIKVFYNSLGLFSGSSITTSDPAEVLILRGLEKNDPVPFPVRPQTILDDVRRVVLSDRPDTFNVDGLEYQGLIELDKAVRIKLPMLGATPISRSESLQDLLGIAEIGQLHLTVEQIPYLNITSAFASMVAAYHSTKLHGDAGRLLAHQIAVAMHSMVGRIAAHSAFVPLLRTMMQRFVHDASFKVGALSMRAHLQEAYVRHELSLNAAFMVLLKLGLLEFGVHEDMIRIFNDENVVEIAVTAENWQDRKSVV